MPTAPPILLDKHAVTQEINRKSSVSADVFGVRYTHVKVLTQQKYLPTLVRIVSRIINAELTSDQARMMSSAVLHALKKGDVGVRPLAVGSVFRRVAAGLLAMRSGRTRR